MTIPLLLAALVLAWILGRLGWRRVARLGYVLVVLAFLAIGCGAVPKLLLRWWQAPYAQRPALAWAHDNAIVLLTAGVTYTPDGPVEPGTSAYARIAETVRLYRACRQAGAHCTVLVSGGDALHVHEPLAATYANALFALGVAPDDVVLEPRSLSTWQNARFSRPVLQRIGAERIWLVSSGYHLRRAQLAFALFGMQVTPVRADYARGLWSPVPAAWNFEMTDAALHEYLGYAGYRWYAWLGRARRQLRADGVDVAAGGH